nr:magnesium transporter [Desulfurispira natronophila]
MAEFVQEFQDDVWEDASVEILENMHIQDIGTILSRVLPDEAMRILQMLPRKRWVEVFPYIALARQTELLELLRVKDGRYILTHLYPDDRTALLEQLTPEQLESFLRLMSTEDVKLALKQLGYPDESVGRLMNTHFVAVKAHWTLKHALEYIRAHSLRGETVNTIFVIDRERRLKDAIELRDFLLGDLSDRVESIMEDSAISIGASEDREEAVRLIKHYDIEVLPVVDHHQVLLGIVTVDDVLDVAEQEATEDFHKMGSVGVLDLSLSDASPALLYRKRVGWLVLLTFVNIFSGAGIAYFEATIEAVIVLVFFLPLIVASSGNAGAQSATLMVRALATGDVQSRDWLRMWGKELLVSVGLGVTMALAISWIGVWRGGADVGLVVALAMFCVVIMGSMVGMLLPFILSRFKLDPATASAPLITSIADVVGIIIYFTIATTFLL